MPQEIPVELLRGLFLLASLVAVSFLFSGTQSAVFSLNPTDRRHLAAGIGDRVFRRGLDLEATVMLGNVATSLAVLAVAATWFGEHMASTDGLILVISTPILIILPEVAARAIGYRFNRAWSRAAIWPLVGLHFAIWPLRFAVTRIVRSLSHAFGVSEYTDLSGSPTPDLMEMVSQGAEVGAVDAAERDIIEAVFEFGELTIGRLMTPRPDIIALTLGTPWKELLEQCQTSSYSRVPVVDPATEEVVGILLTKDLLRHRVAMADTPDGAELGPTQLRSLLLPPSFVPQSKPAKDMLREFLAKKQHMTFLVDDHGTMVGLITLDDLLAELVGEILDDDEIEESEIDEVIPGVLHVKAWMDLDDFNDATELSVPNLGFNTVGGFVFHSLGRLPQLGDIVSFEHAQFTVLEMEKRRISLLRVDLRHPTWQAPENL